MLGKRIKSYISETGLKFNSVSEKIGVPMNTFSAMMNGKRKITAEEYFSICKALGVPVEKFVNVS